MEIKLNINLLLHNNLTPNQATLLFLLYYNKYEDIANMFTKPIAVEIRNSLIGTKYLLNGIVPFKETIISKKEVEKLFDIRADAINFWEFYAKYPIKVGSRALRATGHNTEIAKKHEKKYLSRVRTLEQHTLAIQSLEAYVAKKKQKNELQYLPGMDVVLNNSMWEQWVIFIQEVGTEEQEWNNDTI